MDQLTSIKPPSTLAQLNRQRYSLENHSSIIILGSGESGFMSFGHILNNKKFDHYESLLISQQPINRLSLGSVMYSLRLYNDLDFQTPMIKCYQQRNLVFDTVTNVDPKNQIIELFQGNYYSYDYLLINTGLQVREDHPVKQMILKTLYQEYCYWFENSDFEYFEKIRENLEQIDQFSVLNFYVEDQCQQTINQCVMMRRLNKRQKINIFVQGEYLHTNEQINHCLENIMKRKNINVIYNSKLQIKETIQINDQSMENQFLFCSLKKTQPQFIEQNTDLQQFNKQTFQNEIYGNIFASGSFLYPQSSLVNKHHQVQLMLQNFKTNIINEWDEKQEILQTYQYEPNFLLLEGKHSVNQITQKGESSFWHKKKNSLKFFNRDNINYMFLNSIGKTTKNFLKLLQLIVNEKL